MSWRRTMRRIRRIRRISMMRARMQLRKA